MNIKFLSRKILIITIAFTYGFASIPIQAKPPEEKTVVGGAIEGAIVGGILGNVFGDKKDGKKAAQIGAAIGALKTAEKKKQEKEAREREYRERLRRLEMKHFNQPSNSNFQYVEASPELVTKIQRSLVVLGFMEPPIDGKYTEKLKQTIKTYQRVSKINVDGIPSKNLLIHLLENGG